MAKTPEKLDPASGCGRVLADMKALIQRAEAGSVTIAGHCVGRIETGLVVLLGVRAADTAADAETLAKKTAALRVFSDAAGKMNRSVQDVAGNILVISQFTLYADTRKGNRPSFVGAAPPDQAEQLYEQYVAVLRGILGDDRVATGQFGAMMRVEIINDGPVTIELTTDS